MKKIFMALRIICLYFIVALISAGITKSQTSTLSLEAAKKYGWGYRNNFSELQKTLTWDIYCHSFYGIPSDETEAWISDFFDKTFYELAFEKLVARDGFCFGLNNLSLMMNKYGGYLGLCAPPLSHGNSVVDTSLMRVISIMQGRQLGLSVIQSYIDQLVSGHSQNAEYGLQLAKQTLAKEGAFLIGIVKTFNPDEGAHSLIGYDITNSGSEYKIWVVDPNRLWWIDDVNNRQWYNSVQNYIKINGSEWKFIFVDGEVWPTSEGHLMITPISISGQPQRSPSSLGLSVTDLLTQVYIWGEQESNIFDKNNPYRIYLNSNNTKQFQPKQSLLFELSNYNRAWYKKKVIDLNVIYDLSYPYDQIDIISFSNYSSEWNYKYPEVKKTN